MKSKAQRRAHIRRRIENQELPRFPATRLGYPPADTESVHAFTVSHGSGACHFCGDELSADEWVSKVGATKYHGECHHVWWQEAIKPPKPRDKGGRVMTNGAATERRRQKTQERIRAGRLPASLNAEESTWIPTPYAVGTGPAACHYCDEAIGADEALLVRDGEACHPACEEVWRDIVTGEHGDARG
jgi:hypothetical protein